jgi:hypothetical protein
MVTVRQWLGGWFSTENVYHAKRQLTCGRVHPEMQRDGRDVKPFSEFLKGS